MSLGLRDHLSWWWWCNCNGDDYNEGLYSTGKAVTATARSRSTSSPSASAMGKSEGARYICFGTLFVLQVLGAVSVAVFL